jgi:hypothetical protein
MLKMGGGCTILSTLVEYWGSNSFTNETREDRPLRSALWEENVIVNPSCVAARERLLGAIYNRASNSW